MRKRSSILSALVGAGLALTLSACSSSDTPGAAAAAGAAAALANSISQAVEEGSAAMSSLEAALPDVTDDPGLPTEVVPETTQAVAPVTRDVGKTGWYNGFAITVDDVTAEQSYDNYVDMTVNFSYQNLTIEAYYPDNGDVQADGEALQAYFDNPEIPAGGKAKGTATFTVMPAAAISLDEAIDSVTIYYGDVNDNQTIIPLAKDAEVESQEPKDLAVSGNLTQGQIVIDVVKGSVAPSYDSGEKGKTLINLRIKLTCATGCNAAGWNTGAEQFSLTSPDGTSVVSDQRSDYCCDALYPETVSDDERNILTFVVKSPGTGNYTLTYDNPNITSTGVAPATFEFTA